MPSWSAVGQPNPGWPIVFPGPNAESSSLGIQSDQPILQVDGEGNVRAW
jgi:hypothetical protein